MRSARLRPAAARESPIPMSTNPRATRFARRAILGDSKSSVTLRMLPTRNHLRSSQRAFERVAGTSSFTTASSTQTIFAPCLFSSLKKRTSDPPAKGWRSSNGRGPRYSKDERRIITPLVRACQPSISVPVAKRSRSKNPPSRIHAGGSCSKTGTDGPMTTSAPVCRCTSTKRRPQPGSGHSSSSRKPTQAASAASRNARLRT